MLLASCTLDRNGCLFACLLASVYLDMSAISAAFHLILSPHSVSGKNSYNLLPPRPPLPPPTLECALHAECFEVTGSHVCFAVAAYCCLNLKLLLKCKFSEMTKIQRSYLSFVVHRS